MSPPRSPTKVARPAASRSGGPRRGSAAAAPSRPAPRVTRRAKAAPPPAPQAAPQPVSRDAPERRLPFRIGGVEVPAGESRTVSLPVGRLYTQSEVSMVVRVVHGRRPGPVLFLSAAVHGDELNGVEIIRRLLRLKELRRLRGTLLAVPVVNGFGLIGHSRYLPDRRDLNRSFPGSESGSLAARLAALFMQEVASRATHGIDLHTGALHRSNLPQVRVNFEDAGAVALARSFGVPVVVNAPLRDGSLREAVAAARRVPVLVYEAGEALRFDEWAIRAGLRGVLHAMHGLDMLPNRVRSDRALAPFMARESRWLRAAEGGILRKRAQLGDWVSAGEVLGVIGDPLGEREVEVVTPESALVIGATNLPLVHEGDALYHLATLDGGRRGVESALEAFHTELQSPLTFDPTDGTT